MSIRRIIALTAAFALAAGAGIAQAGKKGSEHHKATAEIGKPAPAFQLTNYDGKTFELSNYKDKLVVLEWFNKDCPVCKQYMPTMKELYAKYGKKGVVWLAIDSTAAHSASDNIEVAKDKKIAYPILSDFDGKVGHLYGAATTPHMFVINKGTLAYMGAIEDQKTHKDYVAEALDDLLAGKKVATTHTKPFGCSVKYKK